MKEKHDDALWVGVDFDEGSGGVPAINIFRKVGDGFELVKMVEGDEALKLYSQLTYVDRNVRKGAEDET